MPADARYLEPRKIIVGVTNEPEARNALRWALRTAMLNDALVVAVTAYEPPRPILTMYGWVCIDSRNAEAAARFVLQNVVQDSLGDVGSDPPRIQAAVVLGDPVTVLVDAARNADLLVIGQRTHRLRHRLVRSIGNRCADRADCPVMIVRGDAPMPPARRLADAHVPDRGDHQPRRHERPHAQIELRRRGR